MKTLLASKTDSLVQPKPMSTAYLLDKLIPPALTKDEIKAPQPTPNPRLREMGQMLQILQNISPFDMPFGILHTHTHYEMIRKLMGGRSYSSSDIEQFTLLLDRSRQNAPFIDLTGLFLSALVNTSPDSSFVLHLRDLSGALDQLGFDNHKTVLIQGDAGLNTAMRMSSGTLRVSGSIHRLSDDIRGGDIFEGERQLVKNGRKIEEPES